MAEAPSLRFRLRTLGCRLRTAIRQPRLQALVFTVVLLALLAVLAHSGLRKGGLFDSRRFNDFRAYHDAAQAALDGRLYEAYAAGPKPYQYPPTLAVLILPLGALPYRAALCVWVALCLASLVLAFRALDRVLCPPLKGIDKFFGFLLAYRMLESDFANGNANVAVLGLMVLGFYLERRARPLAGGLVLALAAAVKAAPILVLPWMLYRRRWRMSAGFTLGLAGWALVLPGTILGPAELGRSYRAWNEGLLGAVTPGAASYAQGAPAGYEPGQSLRALLHRLLRPIDATAHDGAESGEQGEPEEGIVRINIADLPKAAVDAIYAVIGLAVLLGCLLRFRRQSRAPAWGGAEVACAILLPALLAPIARKAAFALALPAAAYAFLVARVSSGRERLRLGALWGLAFLLLVGSSKDVLGERWATLLTAFCPMALASVLLLGALLFKSAPPPRA
jgi:hypothetical protein